ncbi:MAG: MMPL family transporter [Bacteroidetes bacterium]|nr:MMPL family transporter [Bacteroidota bacterium]MDA1120066.1 MMPL family transporter [Bacteroidota bacterium]
MWSFLAHIILTYRRILIATLAIITIYMGQKTQEVEWSFDLAKTVPTADPEMIFFEKFKEQYGEDGNMLAIGLRDSSIYEVLNFRRFKYLVDELAKLSGVNNVLALPNLPKLIKDNNLKKFRLQQIFQQIPDNQDSLNILLSEASKLKFYGQLINEENGATILLVYINKEVLNSKGRDQLIEDIRFAGDAFSKVTGIDLHYAGLPYVRSVSTGKIKKELVMFLILSVAITGLILFLFFRSINAVVIPLIIIGIVVIWSIGTIALLGYKITLLSGLIPSIIVVIGIPNSVYLLNRYHQEYAHNGNKNMALSQIIKKIGIVTFITNFTTAVGFLVLISTDIVILREFGIVAGINIMATFVVSIILIPAVYSYLPDPTSKNLKHLQFKPLESVLTGFDRLVHSQRVLIFVITIGLVIFSVFGIMKVVAVSYMVDDLPEKSDIKQDLHFFENNFSGVMPLEIIVDTGNKKGVQNLKNLRKVEEFELFLDSIEHISQPVSVVSFIKAARQAYYNDNPAFYSLPNNRDQAFILRYLAADVDSLGVSSAFIDSTNQKLRISLRVADIGSLKMDSLVSQVIQPRIKEIFSEGKMGATVTGTTLLFIKGNKFLIENLQTSFLFAFLIIAIIMVILFRNFKMIIISLVPNVIPLMITGGLMGYYGIPLKPSTAIIFSIAFGISVDYSIHFLAKYRQELFANNFVVTVAITKSIRETGASMIYTSVILFCGFIIFALSDFLGTVALGALTSTTLLIAMFTNLIVLPSLLLSFDTGKRNLASHPLIEKLDEFHDEDVDEEIDHDLLEIGENK